MTITAGQDCEDLPADARVRTYAASITLYPGATPPTSYRAQLRGAVFQGVEGWFYPFDGFDAGVNGDVVTLDLDQFGWPAVVEVLSANRYVAYGGKASAVTNVDATTISAELDGWIEFCALASPMPLGYECGERATPTASVPVVFAHCQSTRHRLVLTRLRA